MVRDMISTEKAIICLVNIGMSNICPLLSPERSILVARYENTDNKMTLMLEPRIRGNTLDATYAPGVIPKTEAMAIKGCI